MTCRANATASSKSIVRNNSNKRAKSSLIGIDDEESDGIVPTCETNNPTFHQSKSEPVSQIFNKFF